MSRRKQQRCPLFPENICPQGEKASKACTVRINGDFDPIAQFKDLLVMHCAIAIEQQNKNSKKAR
jgi:hypothetical protein